jgi:predicted metalloenzyme YecM
MLSVTIWQKCLYQGWWTVLRAHAQTVYKFWRILWRTYGSFEEQNKVLERAIIIINYCIIINAYYNYIFN